MSKKNKSDKVIKGIDWVVGCNIILWLGLFVSFPYVAQLIPELNVLVNRCIEIQFPHISNNRIGLARGQTIILLITGILSILQLIHVIPTLIKAIKNQRWEFMKGVIIAAVTTSLLTGQCFLSAIHYCYR